MKRLILLAAILWLRGFALWGQTPPTIAPGSLANGNVGTTYAQVLTASGGYGAGTYTWSLAGGALPPGITLVSDLQMDSVDTGDAALGGMPTTAGTYNFTMELTSTSADLGTLTTTEAFTVVIYPALAIPSSVTIAPGSVPNGIVGAQYLQLFTPSGGYGTGTYTWSLVDGALPPGVTVPTPQHLGLGLDIRGLYGTPTTAGTYNFTVELTSTNANLGTLTTTQSYTVVIYPALAITTKAASSGTVGAPYSQTFAATGGTGTYAWTATASTLPPGLTLSAAGVLSGTPTTPGTYPLAVQVSSNVPTVGTLTVPGTFSVVIATTATFVVTGSLGNGVVGTPYSAALGATGAYGAGTYTFSVLSGAVPTGTTLSAAGVLSGTPTAAGSFAFTVQATSTYTNPSAGLQTLTATEGFTVVIYPALAIATASASSGSVGAAYSQTLTATGGAGASTYTWSLASGTLPPGLTLSAAGVLSGTPTAAGTFSFSVQVSSQVPTIGAQTASQAFSVAITAAPALTMTGSLGGGTVGVPYSGTLTGVGGYSAGAYTFALASGALPAGITLSAGGTLSGTPTAAGTSTFTVQVTSAAAPLPPLTATQSFTVVVYPVLAITTQTASAGTVGTSYSQTFAATGGAGPSSYTWSVANGTLPPGLTFSAAGVLSGTPTTSGTFSLSVQVSSQVPTLGTQTASQSFSVVIAAVPPPTITGTLSGGTAGVPYSATLGATGGYGTGTYAFSVVSGALPAGLTLSAGGALSGTPTAVGTSTFAVQVTSTQSGQPLTATQSFTITVGVAPAPAVTITGLPDTPAPATQPTLGVSAASTYPIAIQGTVTLTFAPDSGPDDPNVQFTTGGRSTTFQIAAGSLLAQFPGSAPGVQTGTVAGTITLTLTLTAAGVDITPTPAPTQGLVVAKSAPVITTATVTAISGGFNLVVVGYSTTRDMVSAPITFTPTSGVTLASNSTTVSLSQVFTTWYQSSASAPFGSMFSLEIPFTIQNGSNPLASVSVALTNSQGSSAAATAAF